MTFFNAIKKQWMENHRNMPPDLEKFLKKIVGFFRKKNKKKQYYKKKLNIILFVIISFIFFIWILSGIFIVQPAQKSVIIRFGKYIKTLNPGLHWIPYFIDTKNTVNTDQIMTMKLEDTMLTSQENIVYVSFAIQYQIENIKNYLFNIKDPKNSLHQIIDSAVREVIGNSYLDDILTIGRAKITEKIRKKIIFLINRYKMGIFITDVAMQPAKAPESVKEAFDDVIKAREDNQRIQNEAEAYVNKKLPIAQGKAYRMLQSAKAYKEQVILKAKGDIARFNALISVYKKYPFVTSYRMYFDTIQEILSKNKVTLFDINKGNIIYIPISEKNNIKKIFNTLH